MLLSTLRKPLQWLRPWVHVSHDTLPLIGRGGAPGAHGGVGRLVCGEAKPAEVGGAARKVPATLLHTPVEAAATSVAEAEVARHIVKPGRVCKPGVGNSGLVAKRHRGTLVLAHI